MGTYTGLFMITKGITKSTFEFGRQRRPWRQEVGHIIVIYKDPLAMAGGGPEFFYFPLAL